MPIFNGTPGNDILTGTAGDDQLYGLEGDDILNAGDGFDSIYDGAGSDQVFGGLGEDTIFAGVGAGSDVYDGGAEAGVQDSVAYFFALAGVNVNLTTGQAQSVGAGDAAGIGIDQLIDIESVHGSSFDDVLIGNSGDNFLAGYDGNDELVGGEGDDRFYSGAGNDLIDGGAGVDWLQLSDAPTGLTVSLALAGPQNTGEGIDTLIGIENLIGSQFDDVFTGNEFANSLAGMDGADHLIGDAGDDTLSGGIGNDNLDGGTGADVLGGEAGDDQLSGGAGIDTLYGHQDNDTLDGGTGADFMWGGTGNDTYIVDDSGDVTSELAGEGIDTVISSVSRFAGSNIENLTLTGSANLNGFGNSLANVLTGNSGANELDAGSGDDTINGEGGDDNLQGWDGSDTLHGGTGNDKLLGGAGNDLLDGGAGIDTVTFITANAGVVVSLAIAGAQDTVAEGSDTLIAVENLIGSHYADRLTGDAGANVLTGFSGDDFLIGGGGTDSLDGGDGSDVYVIASGADHSAAEFGDTGFGGTDEVRFAAAVAGTLTLHADDSGIERVVAGTGTGTFAVTSATTALNINAAAVQNALTMIGNAGDNILTATAFNDTLLGGAGLDRLISNGGDDLLDGGTGADKLFGGGGNDTYIVDHASDIVIEYSGEGTDTVHASVAHTLRDNVENLILTGIYSIHATGNALANEMVGNSGANKLYGLAGDDMLIGNEGNDTLDGGAGADLMFGGAGNENYYVDDAGDQVFEAAGEGLDTVRTTIGYTLGADVENLILLGSDNLSGTGNSLLNVITGNSGNNLLAGLDGGDTLKGLDGNDHLDGGSGNDRLYGGTGDDVYFVDTTGDFTIEYAGEGSDTVYSSVTLTLQANVEHLILTGLSNLSGTGNELDNSLHGNDGNNIFYGGLGADQLNGNGGADVLKGEGGNDWLEGGSGRDRFYGGAGADQFVFADGSFAGMTSSTSDQIHDFSQAEGDFIALYGVDADTTADGDQAFAFIGSGAFTGTAGELRYSQISGNTYVMGDTDGDGAADFWIRLDGLHTLGGSDFVL